MISIEVYKGQLKNYKFNCDKYRNHNKKNGGIKLFSNDVLTFDIEVSSAWLEDGKVIGYKKGLDSDYWNNLTPLALCYIWQFSIEGKVYYGRELYEFLNVLNDIPKDINVIIWVHNLAYEFQFLCNILKWSSIFARSNHKVMKCTPKDFPNIEFRCSYFLTRLSLASWGLQLGLPKKVGDLDYDVLRTPLTPLTEVELGYCETDCLVVEKGIKKYLEKYKTIRNIPLTQTGTVRQEVKEMLMKDASYVSDVKRLVPKTAEEYKRLITVFAGGYTHANKYWAGNVIEGYIEHYDFASSYPTVMVCEKYPMSPWIYMGLYREIPPEYTFNDFAYIMELTFHDIKSTSYNTYIQRSKAIDIKKAQYDNGRVVKAESIKLFITEQDYITIKNNYTWENVEVHHVYKSVKKYLPKEFIEYILDLYSNKTSLKDVEGMEDLYMQSKQYINSMFGMMVTAILQPNVTYSEEEGWYTEPLTKTMVEDKLAKLSSRNPREKRYFLSYSWGCWVTAYARRNLWKCIESCDREMIYCDTDSIFVLGKHDFSWYDKEITEKLKTACNDLGIDFNKTRPKTKKGVEKPLGLFTQEEPCSEFITLGAKRYVERRICDNKLHLTVSGINKESVALLEDDISNFTEGFNFDKDSDYVTKKISTYITEMPICTYPDGYVSVYQYGINLRRNGYLLSITDEYKNIMDLFTINLDDITEEFRNHLQTYFSIFS